MRKTKTQIITELTSSFRILNEKYYNLLCVNEELENKYNNLRFVYKEKIKRFGRFLVGLFIGAFLIACLKVGDDK